MAVKEQGQQLSDIQERFKAMTENCEQSEQDLNNLTQLFCEIMRHFSSLYNITIEELCSLVNEGQNEQMNVKDLINKLFEWKFKQMQL
jgi:Mg2+ and Co2+ transporter CorA